MEKTKLEELRAASRAQQCWNSRFAIDVKKAPRKALKYRRDAENRHRHPWRRGWFDPLSDAKGDVFGLAEHLDASPRRGARPGPALSASSPGNPAWTRPAEKARSQQFLL